MPIGLNNDTNSVSVSEELVATVGTIIAGTTKLAPTGYLACDGSAASRTAYSRLFNVIVPSRGIITITIASPGVITLNNHDFITGESIFITTTGTLPTGLSINTLYYVINVNSTTFRLALSYANAIAGTAINTSGTQSGIHTLFYCPYGITNSQSTTFNLPDLRGQFLRGLDSGRGVDTSRTLGSAQSAQNLSHSHTVNSHSHGGGSHTHNYSDNYIVGDYVGGSALNPSGGPWAPLNYTFTTGSPNSTVISSEAPGTNSNGGTDLRPVNVSVNYFIKY